MNLFQRSIRTPRPPRRKRPQRRNWAVAADEIRRYGWSRGFTGDPYLIVNPERETAVVSSGRYASVWCAACRVGFWPQQPTPGQREDAAIRWVHAHNTARHPRRWSRELHEHFQHFQAPIPAEVRERVAS